MKKLSIMLTFMLTFLFSACSSSMFNKLVEAYESSTKELASASSNDDCDRIHDELMEKLYKISQEYPDWEEIIQKEGKDSENFKKVTKAYKTWNNTLKDATTDDYYMFMTYCNIPNAIEQITGKGASKKTEDTNESEETSDNLSSSSSDTNIDEMLDSYEEYVDKLSDFYAKLKDMEIGSEEYMSTLSEAQNLEGSYQDLFEKCKDAKGNFTSEQLHRYTKITQKLTEVMK